MRSRRKRVFVVWSPVWEGTIKNWATSFIKNQRWRCDHIHEQQDLEQEAYLIFMKLEARYPRVIEPKHFMALFQTSFRNFLNDKSSYLQRKNMCHLDLPLDVSDLCTGHIGEITNSGYLNVLLAEAPQELRLALALVTQEPYRLVAPVRPREPRENLNMKLRRILGLENTFDLKAAITDLLFN